MPDPYVVQVMRQFKADLLLREREQVTEMTRRWLAMERELQDAFASLALEIDQYRFEEATDVIPAWKIKKMARYRSLLDQVRAEIERYNGYASGTIQARQLEFAMLGIEHGAAAIQAYYATYGLVAGAFNVLPVSAVAYMVGLAGDGSPLHKLLSASFGDAVDGITNELLKAVTMGLNPRETARAMAKGFGVGLDRALNIARTEQLRTYRESNRETYRHSGLVGGYKRLSARDGRVCPACLFADDGKVLDLGVSFEEHPQGRCTLVPVVKGMPVVQWESGITWFMAQGAGVQSGILGPGKYEAWKEDRFDLADLVKRRENKTWGASLVPASLAELVGND